MPRGLVAEVLEAEKLVDVVVRGVKQR